MDANQFREAAHAAIEDIIQFNTTLARNPVTPPLKPGYLRPLLPATAPSQPQPWRDLLTDVHSLIKPGLTHWQHPNFFAFYPATSSYPSLLGELYSAAFNAPAFNWLCSPACTELEAVVMDWLHAALALPPAFHSSSTGGGVIQGSASEAILVAMVAARERTVRAHLATADLLERPDESPARARARDDAAASLRARLVALGSDQSHSSTAKAAGILGLRYRSVPAPAATGFRVTGAALRAAVDECAAQGLIAVYFTATIGTTGTCAVDDLAGIAGVRAQHPALWVHVDAAYAGAALVCPELRAACAAEWLSEVDSFDFNMHKWMLVNFDASCMFVAQRAELVRALSITRSYLVNPESLRGEQVTDYRDWQLPLGRRFRSLKIWFVLRTYGVEGIRAMIREHVRLGERFAALCRGERARRAGLVVVTGPAFALTVVRFVAPGGAAAAAQESRGEVPASEQATTNGAAQTSEQATMNGFGQTATPAPAPAATPPVTAASNALTQAIAERINARGQFFLTPAVADGVNCIRVVGANPNTSEESVDAVFETLLETAASVGAEG